MYEILKYPLKDKKALEKNLATAREFPHPSFVEDPPEEIIQPLSSDENQIDNEPESSEKLDDVVEEKSEDYDVSFQS